MACVIEEYEQLLEDLEELESIHAYDAAKASDDEVIPLEEEITEVEQNRQCLYQSPAECLSLSIELRQSNGSI
jgi:hypothetical protein